MNRLKKEKFSWVGIRGIIYNNKSNRSTFFQVYGTAVKFDCEKCPHSNRTGISSS